MSLSPEIIEPGLEPEIERFTRAERWTHRTIAILMGLLIVSAAFLYVPDLSALIGNRPLLKWVHVISGFALPIPIIVALFFAAFRLDLGRLNRFTPDDWRWLRTRKRGWGTIPVGKFNAGQKLNSAFQLGAIAVMLGTGLIMWFNGFFEVAIRTGATFVHDWLALLITIVVIGHSYMAYRDPVARRGMRKGFVPRDWARRNHSDWNP